MSQPNEADKAAAEEIGRLAKEYFDSRKHVGPLLVAYSAELISHHMAPERAAAAEKGVRLTYLDLWEVAARDTIERLRAELEEARKEIERLKL